MKTNLSSEKPLVSVYIPTKNRIQLLKRAINSVLAQTYDNIEIIVVDDGSSDNTPIILKELSEYYSNLHFYRFDTSQGAPAARNYAIDKAKGKLITGLDDDDYFLPKRIESLVSNFDERYTFICSGYYWNHGKTKIKKFDSRKTLTLDEQLYFNQASNQVLMETEKLRAVGGFDLSFSSCQDWELWVRLIKKFGPALRINDVEYVVDASHPEGRITNSPKRVEGFRLLASRYKSDMNYLHHRTMRFNYLVASKEKLTLSLYLQLVTVKSFLRVTKYWFACIFPNYAKNRLNKMK
ncbi:glycosyltransferase family 2 protein [Pseudoalteromonas aurantia]|uniref:Glycosyl transferase n=1 Tax=Pseudoalteromonas aurantia TaxID=43654 RepID=A0A5S3VCQ8_9GAMM|nr:glycosyltransferase family 2 protein [Pseudoalteromonas aurantia]TMO69982.1 glycosyl transferase [Pseudoalteromonas aurantia]TMO75956.1 glycosyl transferase [Pseudoalteromonas aurantia]